MSCRSWQRVGNLGIALTDRHSPWCATQMGKKIVKRIREKGPLTGSEIIEGLGGQRFAVWRTCLLSKKLHVRVLGSRYLRLDRRIMGYARLSPSILREFMTYSVVGARLVEMEAKAVVARKRAEDYVPHTELSTITKEDLYFFTRARNEANLSPS